MFVCCQQSREWSKTIYMSSLLPTALHCLLPLVIGHCSLVYLCGYWHSPHAFTLLFLFLRVTKHTVTVAFVSHFEILKAQLPNDVPIINNNTLLHTQLQLMYLITFLSPRVFSGIRTWCQYISFTLPCLQKYCTRIFTVIKRTRYLFKGILCSTFII
jgi:hypothetical protein